MRILFWLALAFFITGGAAPARASNYDEDVARQTLKGLQGVPVLVEGLEPQVEQAGLNETSIQTVVELRLRQAGIPVLSKASRVPFLYVNANVSHPPGGEVLGIWRFSIKVALVQGVALMRDPTIMTVADTWSADSSG